MATIEKSRRDMDSKFGIDSSSVFDCLVHYKTQENIAQAEIAKTSRVLETWRSSLVALCKMDLDAPQRSRICDAIVRRISTCEDTIRAHEHTVEERQASYTDCKDSAISDIWDHNGSRLARDGVVKWVVPDGDTVRTNLDAWAQLAATDASIARSIEDAEKYPDIETFVAEWESLFDDEELAYMARRKGCQQTSAGREACTAKAERCGGPRTRASGRIPARRVKGRKAPYLVKTSSRCSSTASATPPALTDVEKTDLEALAGFHDRLAGAYVDVTGNGSDCYQKEWCGQ